jgi:hypothetical protein
MLTIVSYVTTLDPLLGRIVLVVSHKLSELLGDRHQYRVKYIHQMESSVPSGKPQTEPPRNKWGEFWGSAIAIFTLILPVVAIVHYSPTSQVQALPTLPSTARPE